MTREKLPNRRRAVTIDFDHVIERGVNGLPGKSVPYRATLGYYDDGRLGEVFIESAQKVATGTDIAVRDAAIGVSIGLQYGVDAEVLVPSFLRDANGRSEGVLGQLMEKLREENLLKIFPFKGLHGSER